MSGWLDRVARGVPERAPGPQATLWRYRPDGEPAFDPVVFDERALAARGALLGNARAGRGNTHFLVLERHALVLRHYRRGGLVRHLATRHYVWTGLERTRAVREFELLRELEAEGLPAPVPFACAVTRRGPFWSGSLVTRRLPGETLAERLDVAGDATLPRSLWSVVGQTLARFHAVGIRHADLNAHNVLLDGERVFLIDFDRASRREPPGERRAEVRPWQRANVARLRRSLVKLAAGGERAFDEPGFDALERAWRSHLERASSGSRSIGC